VKIPLFALLAATSWVSAQEIDDAFTLGRLVGPNAQLGLAVDEHASTTSTASVFQFRLGRADRWALDIPLVLASASNSNASIKQYVLPGLRLGLHPTEGLILDASLMSSNLWLLTTESDGVTGFDEGVPRILHSGLFAHYVGNEGRIALDEQAMDFAFQYGPLVNAGQIDLQGHYDGTHVDTSEVRGYGVLGRYGIQPGLQAWGGYADTLLKSYRNTYVTMGGSRVLVNSVEFRSSLQTLDLGADWVSGRIRAGGQIEHAEVASDAAPSFDEIGTLAHWKFMGYAGYLDGGRRATGGEVAGNWNGFFSPLLTQGQYDLEDSLVVIPEESQTEVQLRGSARYGVLEPVTIGMNYDLSFADETSKSFTVTASLSNIPRRAQGPRQATALEYLVGYVPKAQEGQLLVELLVPGSDLVSYGKAQELQQDPMGTYYAPWDRRRKGWTREPALRPDFRARGIVGVSDAFYLVGSAARVDRFSSSLSGGSYDILRAWVFDLGLGYHSGNTLFQLQLPYYSGTGSRYWNRSALEYRTAQDSRFGPVQFSLVSSF